MDWLWLWTAKWKVLNKFIVFKARITRLDRVDSLYCHLLLSSKEKNWTWFLRLKEVKRSINIDAQVFCLFSHCFVVSFLVLWTVAIIKWCYTKDWKETKLHPHLSVLKVTNFNFLLMISIHHQEIRIWELIKWSPKRKCFDPFSKFSQLKKIYRDQFGEFVCVYWGLKSFFTVVSTKLRNARFVLLFFFSYAK